MFYPILTVMCLLVRGQLGLQRKDIGANKTSINSLIAESCGAEQLSKLLTNPIIMVKAIELAAAHHGVTTEQLMQKVFLSVANKPISMHSDRQNQNQQTQDNELRPVLGNSPPILTKIPNFAPTFKSRDHHLPINVPFRDSNIAPALGIDNVPMFMRPPAGAKVIVELNDKVKEVIITVSPHMSVIDAIKQAEIKFQRILRLSLNDEIISFTLSPILDCYIVSNINGIKSDIRKMWKVMVTNKSGEVEYDDFCLPSTNEIIIKPESIIELIYTSIDVRKN